MKWVCHNGAMVPAAQPLFTAQNRGFRYGDGLFETIKVYKGAVLLWPLHVNRLTLGLQLLQITVQETYTPNHWHQLITELCAKNNCTALGRVRLAVYRSEEGMAGFVLEAAALEEASMQWNEEGWALTIYPLGRKSTDAFANLKSANYLLYLLAARYAAQNGADEALVLNVYNKLADGSKTNFFYIKGNEIFTPALHQGCVSGVMRLFVIDTLKAAGFIVHQTEVNEAELLAAEEMFCTNAVQGLRWVRQLGNKTYGCNKTKEIYKLLAATIEATFCL